MNARLRARLAHRARQLTDDDLRAGLRWRDSVFAWVVIALIAFGAPLADWAIPPDDDAGIDPAGETELAWISDAPSLWTVERVELPPAPELRTWDDFPADDSPPEVWKRIQEGE